MDTRLVVNLRNSFNQFIPHNRKKSFHPGGSVGVLEQIEEVQQKIYGQGFGFKDKERAIANLQEETEELILALRDNCMEGAELEVADVLYIVVSLCYLSGVNWKRSAELIEKKLTKRLELMQQLSSTPIKEMSDIEQRTLSRMANEILKASDR